MCCLSKAALISLGYEEVALDDFWQAFLQELDNLPNMELGQLEVCFWLRFFKAFDDLEILWELDVEFI